MRAAFALPLVLLLVPGCGHESAGGGSRKPLIPIVDAQDPPAEYMLADPDCQSQSAPVPLTKITVRAWDGHTDAEVWLTEAEVAMIEPGSGVGIG